MNCNDCGGVLPRGCECSAFGGRYRTSPDGLARTLIAPDAAAPMVPSPSVTVHMNAPQTTLCWYCSTSYLMTAPACPHCQSANANREPERAQSESDNSIAAEQEAIHFRNEGWL